MKALTLDYFVGDKVWIMWPDAPKTSGLVAQIRILPGIIEYVVDVARAPNVDHRALPSSILIPYP